MKCLKCSYEWDNRKEHPKVCPRCKIRLDTPYKIMEACKNENVKK